MGSLPLLDPGWWNWYLLGVLLICAELLSPGVWLFWLGLGALFAGVVTQLAGGFDWKLQFLIFAAASVVSVYCGRRFIRRAAPAESGTLNQRLQQYIGREGRLEGALANGRGRIKLDDTYWTVRGPDLPAGTRVRVDRIVDGVLVVEPLGYEEKP